MTSRRIVAVAAVASLFVVPDLASAADVRGKARRAAPRAPVSDVQPITDRPFEVNLSTGLRHYSWTETRADGSQFVSESGMLFVIGATPRLSLGQERRFIVESGIEVYFGSVGYDGGIQGTRNGQRVEIPGTGSTGYFGFEVNPRAGYVFSLGNRFQITPLAGLSLEAWKRDLTGGLKVQNPDGTTATVTSGGYVENYTAFFVQTAVRAAYTVSRDVRLNGMLSVKIPLSISEGIDQPGQPALTLNPGISPRLGLEAGASFHRFNAALTFDRWTLTQSPAVRGSRQPDSTRTLFGVRFGYAL